MDKRISLSIVALLLLALLAVVSFSLRAGGSATQAPPTEDLGLVRTQAVETFVADMTGTAQGMPTATASHTAVPTESGATSGTAPVTPACHGLRFVRDVTIPDNTTMTPAQVFTKSWLVENTGTCPWFAGYQVVLIGGLAMGGSPFKLIQDVGPGGRIQVSIKMVAPTNQTGVVQGTWKMSDDTGTTFGDYMSVVIVVGSGTGTPSAATATPTP